MAINQKQLKAALGILLAVGIMGAFILFTLWRNTPVQLGKTAFAATGMPKHTLEQAVTLADEQGKPLLLAFSAYWCSSCRRFDRSVLTDSEVQDRIHSHYVFVRLDSEEPQTRELMRRYGIHGYPALLVTQTDGTALRSLPLSFSPETFLQAL